MSDTDRARDVEVRWCQLVPTDPRCPEWQPERFPDSFGARQLAAGTFYERADEDQRSGAAEKPAVDAVQLPASRIEPIAGAWSQAT